MFIPTLQTHCFGARSKRYAHFCSSFVWLFFHIYHHTGTIQFEFCAQRLSEMTVYAPRPWTFCCLYIYCRLAVLEQGLSVMLTFATSLLWLEEPPLELRTAQTSYLSSFFDRPPKPFAHFQTLRFMRPRWILTYSYLLQPRVLKEGLSRLHTFDANWWNLYFLFKSPRRRFLRQGLGRLLTFGTILKIADW